MNKELKQNSQSITKNKQKQTWYQVLFKSSLMGSIICLISLPFQHPFQVLTANMQSEQNNMRIMCKQIFIRKGIFGFYSGIHVNAIRVTIKQLYRWPLNVSISQFYKNLLHNTNQIIRQACTGFTISLLQLMIVCPLQRIKIWIVTTKTRDLSKIRKYYKISFNLKDLYTGFTPMLIRQGLSWTSFLSSFQIFKSLMKKYRGYQQLSTFDLILIGIPVSIINTTCIMPIDCIKTFYQSYDGPARNKKLLTVIKKSLTLNGLKGLYFGFKPRLIQSLIHSTFTLPLLQYFYILYKNIV